MRFAFRKKPAPRWIDSADLNWVPEEPLAFGPGVAAETRAAPAPEPPKPQPEPRAEPQAKTAEEPIFFGPGFSSDEAFRAFVEPRPREDAPPEAPLPPPAPPSEAANTNRAPRLWLTRLGIGLTATGEHPKAVTAAGYNVLHYRFYASLGCGALCGIAGAALSIGISNNFTDNMTASRGFVALALIVVGRWSPIWTALGTLGFASLDVLQASLQAGGNTWLPYPILLALPYILTLVALGTAKASIRPPKYLGITTDRQI